VGIRDQDRRSPRRARPSRRCRPHRGRSLTENSCVLPGSARERGRRLLELSAAGRTPSARRAVGAEVRWRS
jgi:hypothetical protein